MKALVLLFLTGAAAGLAAELKDPARAIRAAELDALRPYFIPTHPRVTTTIRFPGEVGAPEGAVDVFAEDAAKAPAAEYLVAWQEGDRHVTVTPSRSARMANLNIPYGTKTYVFFFYPVADPPDAVASFVLDGAAADTTGRHGSSEARQPFTVKRGEPSRRQVAVTPARLLGFIDRLRIIHAAPAGARLDELRGTMGVEVAELTDDTDNGLRSSVHPGRGFEIVLLRVVRDPRLNCIGFICLIRNCSTRTLVFDVSSFGARAGSAYYTQRVSDAPAELGAGEQRPAYFVIESAPHTPLRVDNAWQLSVDLVRLTESLDAAPAPTADSSTEVP